MFGGQFSVSLCLLDQRRLKLRVLSAAANCSKWSAFSKYSATIFISAIPNGNGQYTTPKRVARSTFYRSVETGAGRIASYLNARGVHVR